MKHSQYNGNIDFKPSDKIFSPADKIKVPKKELFNQKEELIFAYQTLEIGYQRYWEFFNYAPDGYLVTDTQGIIREANQTILSMLSVSLSQLLGRPISELIPEVGQKGLGIQLNWFSSSQQLEVPLQSSSKPGLYASISIAPQCNLQNEPIGLLWLVRDITRHREIEEALHKSNSELNLMLEQIPCAIWTTDKDLKITSALGTGLHTFYLPPEELIGRNIMALDHMPEQTIIKAHLNALAGETQNYELERQGHVFQSMVKALKDSKGQITGVVNVSFDITERKQTEKTLELSEKFNSRLLESSPNPILVIQEDTSINYVNPAFEKLTGFSAQKLIGKKVPYPWWTDHYTDSSLKMFPKKTTRKNRKQEVLFQKKNREQFWVEVTSIPINNKDHLGNLLQAWVDITESKRLKENMEFYIRQVTRIQEEERKHIAQSLHEEILQSLAALCLATEAIIKTANRDPKGTARNITELRDKINGVIEEVRRFSYDLRPGVLDYLGLTAALESLIEDMNARGIQSQLVISGKEKPFNPDLEITLFRIAQEALSNVKKYSGANNVNVDVQYSRTKIKLTISDNGRGFTVPDRLSDFANEGKLGIIGIEERSRLYGGTFSIRAQPEKGTQITVILPLSAKRTQTREETTCSNLPSHPCSADHLGSTNPLSERATLPQCGN